MTNPVTDRTYTGPVPENIEQYGIKHQDGKVWNIRLLREEIQKIIDSFPDTVQIVNYLDGWKSGDLQILVGVIDSKPYEYRLKYFTDDSEIGDYIFTVNADGSPDEILNWFREFPQKISDIFIDYKTRYTEKLFDYNLEG